MALGVAFSLRPRPHKNCHRLPGVRFVSDFEELSAFKFSQSAASLASIFSMGAEVRTTDVTTSHTSSLLLARSS